LSSAIRNPDGVQSFDAVFASEGVGIVSLGGVINEYHCAA
jgi:hypothetical protein